MGENWVPSEHTINVNPNGGKQGGIPEKESPGIANPKGDLNGCQQNYSQVARRKIPTKIPAEVIPRYQQKQRGVPKVNPHLNFTP